ncbi:multicopper oxidase family protein [Polyangium aurulentum]|uniref:multicopper oxidase family protein n=1 Tax=Polyangium aurulentum TaxID=2567896 RepID=UPI0010ADB866|nr:multicopper oxidase family protein [Polyangium aurulentum]UQA57261.1 multicopper oxidase family protein [Polyangium aurulentum]
MSFKLVLFAAGLTLAPFALGCADEALPSQPAGWDSAVTLREAVDKNPDPAIVEVDLSARPSDLEILPGTTTPAWTYDGGLPGPFIRAKLGDRVIVHFKNELPSPTTVHWHGIRVPANMDGTPGHSQPDTLPGESFTYDFVASDPGLYWYHPHVDSAVQVGNGLYGPLLVDDPGEGEKLGDELVLVLSDMAIAEDGSLEDPKTGGNFGTLFGREGNVLLVNGRVDPTIEARAGLRQRWRIVNAAKSRYYYLAIAGHEFTRIGGDGGWMEHPVETDKLLLTPGERADVLVEPRGAPGSTLSVRWVPYDRGYGTTFNRPEEEVFRIHLTNEPAAEAAPLPTIARSIEALDTAGAKPVKLTLTQSELNGEVVMGINGVPSWEANPLMAAVGETEVWTIDNTMEFDHPFHLHGFFFQPLDESGAPIRPIEWKDTLNVAVDGTSRFAVKYDNRPGMWMFHCHILDHADAGMMGMVQLQQ